MRVTTAFVLGAGLLAVSGEFFLGTSALAQTGQRADTPADVYDGGELYAMNCANCHGIYGEGDGAVTPNLSVVLLDLRYLSARNDGQYPEEFVTSVIDGRETRAAHGPEGMPVWGAEFARSEGTSQAALDRISAKIDAIVNFLRSIQLND